MKIMDYPTISDFASDNILLTDGENGTKKIAVVDGILSALHLISPINHRNIFRGKNLGTTVTSAQKARIQDGSFHDMWLGDYWVINGKTWRIVDFDYWYEKGDTKCHKHHLVIMPDTQLYTAAMNSSSDTTGGYVGSAMYKSNLANAKSMINSAFGGIVLNHREYLINGMSSGCPYSGSWYDSTVELPTSIMVTGNTVFNPGSKGTETPDNRTVNTTQLALFANCPTFISDTYWYWLRDPVSTTGFIAMATPGNIDCYGASASFGVRPVFGIC